MLKLLTKLMFLLNRKRRVQFAVLVVLMFLSAMAEVISLGLIVPFLGLLIAPDKLSNLPYVGNLAADLGYTTGREVLLILTISFVAMSFLAGFIRMIQLWASTRVTFAAGSDISLEIYRRTLYQPYLVHLSRNSSVVISSVTEKVNQIAFWILQPLVTFLSSILMLVFVTVTLILISPKVACISIVSFGLAYVVILKLTKKKIYSNSLRIATEQTRVVKALQEGLGGIRDVLLDGTQNFYTNLYRSADSPLRIAHASNIFISGFPRFIMESFGIALISGFAYYLSIQSENGAAAAFPILGVLALGAQRLLPALQNGYNAWTSINGSRATLRDVLDLLQQPLNESDSNENIEKMQFEQSIEFKNVSFRYNKEMPLILNKANLSIKRGSRVGFVGTTGSGKSTTLDLLMGLLNPESGEIQIDGQSVSSSNMKAWQKNIAHVPQNIYLSDASIAENIAFGMPKNQIDMDKVRTAASKAQISDYIESSLGGYEAFVGERGIRLSGGQRQRIGIARALYKDATVIVFDEATSALDAETERNVMSAIESLSHDLTILIIAHRTSTLVLCDVIVTLQNGVMSVKEQK
jgi:ATP-binding cassette subfamily B protein